MTCPCPGVGILGALYVHIHPVTCAGCEHQVRLAGWLNSRHYCPSCLRRGGA